MDQKNGYSKDFEFFFWSWWPKKVGKFNAQKEFDKRKFDAAGLRRLLEHGRERVKTDRKWIPNEQGKTFIMDAERFLKHRRDEDEYEKVRVTSQKEKRYYDVEPDVDDTPIARNPEAAKAALARIKWELH